MPIRQSQTEINNMVSLQELLKMPILTPRISVENLCCTPTKATDLVRQPFAWP